MRALFSLIPLGNVVTAEERLSFARSQIYPHTYSHQGSVATDDERWGYVRWMSAVDLGSPNRLPTTQSTNASDANKCPRRGIFD